MFNFMFPQQNGVLSQNPQMMGQQPILAGATGNARGSNRMPQIPNNRIGLGEAMMRIGGSGLGQSANGGGNAVYGSMMNQYGQIQDYNRQADMERMRIEEERMLEEQRRQDLMRKMNAPKTMDQEPTEDASGEIARLEDLLTSLKTDPNMTGPIAGRAQQALDRSGFGDPKRAAKRLILAELQVNATLAFTAQTKGAITDREMEFFKKPIPQLIDDEGLWVAWLEPQLEILKQLQQNGITDEAAKQQGIIPSNSGSTPEPTVDDLVNQYDPQN